MNHGPLLFLGILAALASSFWGLLIVPQSQLGRQTAVVAEETGAYYPTPRDGLAQRGAEVYRSLGCAECHTRQVRGLGGDLARALGRRISVAQDYLYDRPVLLGQLRLGSDLSNVGVRQPDLGTHWLRLYNPRLVAPGSTMPRYPFLFERRKLKPGQPRSPEALKLDDAEPDQEIVPTAAARALAAYLVSLRTEPELFEAPIPRAKTNGAPSQLVSTNFAAATNAAAVTNAAAATNVGGTNAAATTNAPPATNTAGMTNLPAKTNAAAVTNTPAKAETPRLLQP